MHGERGSLSQQVDGKVNSELAEYPDLIFRSRPSSEPVPLSARTVEPRASLHFANRWGGFSEDGREYEIRLSAERLTPAPWSNVVANERFGFLITESGGGYTWAHNSRENKLTTWCNDPVSDSPSEILYLRDDETGDVWSPTPVLRQTELKYQVNHGQGYTRFVHQSHGIAHELTCSIDPSEKVKIVILSLRNDSDRHRSLSATYYVEWVLGVVREQTQWHLWTSVDESTGALLAHQPYHEDYPNQLAFLHILERPFSITGDRREFIGRNGELRMPAAMRKKNLSGAVGAGLDPCGAIQTNVRLAPGEQTEVVILLGQVDRPEELNHALTRYQTVDQAQGAIEQTATFWNKALSSIEVDTPNLCAESARQSVVDLPNAELPCLGTLGILPIGWRLWIPRSASRRDGPGL